MTHPLLTPRYMVEADYPNSPFRVGDIIYKPYPEDMLVNDKDLYTQIQVFGRKSISYYPHIFRPMHWSEQRGLGEMPRYLRFVDSPTHVLQVDTYLLGKVLFNEHVAWQPIEWYTPATEAEYLEYLKSKEK